MKLKKIPADNKGLPMLSEEVRNKMGYMKKGGKLEYMYGGMMKKKKKKKMMGGGRMEYGHGGMTKSKKSPKKRDMFSQQYD
jgi:hypothetical protein